MGFELVELSVLKVFKMPIHISVGLADHYYLSELGSWDNSVGWGPKGLELWGKVRVTPLEMERIDRFIADNHYDISVNNCEHFANYVLHGLNFSSQQHIRWKNLGAEIISILQPTQSIGENYNNYIYQQISAVLEENLRQAKIDQANRERIEFWRARGIEVK